MLFSVSTTYRVILNLFKEYLDSIAVFGDTLTEPTAATIGAGVAASCEVLFLIPETASVGELVSPQRGSL